MTGISQKQNKYLIRTVKHLHPTGKKGFNMLCLERECVHVSVYLLS